VHRLLARGEYVIVIDDDKTSARHFVIERVQNVHGRFVEVSVHPQHGQLHNGSGRQRILEPAFEELHLIVQQSESFEGSFDVRLGNCERGKAG